MTANETRSHREVLEMSFQDVVRCPCNPKGGKHDYLADPVRLFHGFCRFGCGTALDCSQTKTKQVPNYLRLRRKTKDVFGLLSVAAPLDFSSTRLLTDVSSECNIVSSDAMLYLVYADGLWPMNHQPDDIDKLRKTVQNYPTMVIQNLHHVRRTDDKSRMVVANVQVPKKVRQAVDRIVFGDACTLPPFPLYVVLGYNYVDKHKASFQSVLQKARKLLVGKTLRVSSERMRTLSPVDFDAWSPWCQVDNNDHGIHLTDSKIQTSLERKKPKKKKTRNTPLPTTS